jgi:hypothetical protein
LLGFVVGIKISWKFGNLRPQEKGDSLSTRRDGWVSLMVVIISYGVYKLSPDCIRTQEDSVPSMPVMDFFTASSGHPCKPTWAVDNLTTWPAAHWTRYEAGEVGRE